MLEWVLPAILTIITASTPLVFAAVGEVLVEKSGASSKILGHGVREERGKREEGEAVRVHKHFLVEVCLK